MEFRDSVLHNTADVEVGGYPAVLRRFSEGEIDLELVAVENLDAWVDGEALLRDDSAPEPPYWAHLWVGAVALARSLADPRLELRNRVVLDLGCGLGLPGLVAARRGANVCFADREPRALDFARASVERNALAARFAAVDFARDDLHETFDVILGAEIVYDPTAYGPLADFLDRHLRGRGEIRLTDAFRSDAKTFFAELDARGFAGEATSRREPQDGRLEPVRLWTFRRRYG